MTTDIAAEHIERLSEKHLGQSYPSFSGRAQIRVIITIEAERASRMRERDNDGPGGGHADRQARRSSRRGYPGRHWHTICCGDSKGVIC